MSYFKSHFSIQYVLLLIFFILPVVPTQAKSKWIEWDDISLSPNDLSGGKFTLTNSTSEEGTITDVTLYIKGSYSGSGEVYCAPKYIVNGKYVSKETIPIIVFRAENGTIDARTSLSDAFEDFPSTGEWELNFYGFGWGQEEDKLESVSLIVRYELDPLSAYYDDLEVEIKDQDFDEWGDSDRIKYKIDNDSEYEIEDVQVSFLISQDKHPSSDDILLEDTDEDLDADDEDTFYRKLRLPDTAPSKWLPGYNTYLLVVLGPYIYSETDNDLYDYDRIDVNKETGRLFITGTGGESVRILERPDLGDIPIGSSIEVIAGSESSNKYTIQGVSSQCREKAPQQMIYINEDETATVNLDFGKDLCAPAISLFAIDHTSGNTITNLTPIELEVNLNDLEKVKWVEFYVDDRRIWRDNEEPFQATWLPLYSDEHTINAIAILEDDSKEPSNELTLTSQHPLKEIEGEVYATGAPKEVANARSILDYLEYKYDKDSFVKSPVVADILIGERSPMNSGEHLLSSDGKYKFKRITTGNEIFHETDFGPQATFFAVAYDPSDKDTEGVYIPIHDFSFKSDSKTLTLSLSNASSQLLKNRLPSDWGQGDQDDEWWPKIRIFRSPDYSIDSTREKLSWTPFSCPDLATLEHSPDEKKLIILIHGWNRGRSDNQFEEGVFSELALSIHSEVSCSDWTVLGYNWGKDAATGGTVLESEKFGDVAEGGTRSALMGYQNGLALGHYLREKMAANGQISKIHFIAHSAGTWCTYGTVKQLLNMEDDCPDIQITLLDPYLPGNTMAKNHFFDKEMIDGLLTDSWGKIEVLDNYYTIDITGPGTHQKFSHENALNAYVGVDYCFPKFGYCSTHHNKPYFDHSGPITFYSDSVLQYSPSEYAQQPPWGWPETIRGMGWNGSMFRNENALRTLISKTNSFSTSGVVITPQPGAILLETASDSWASDVVEVNPDGGFLVFNYLFSGNTENDRLVLSINGEETWSASASDFNYTTPISSPHISLNNWAGESINYQIRLDAESGKDIEVLIDQFTIYSNNVNLADTNPPRFLNTGWTDEKAIGQSIEIDPITRGAEPITVQWYKDSVLLESGTKTLSLSLSNLTTEDTGNYYCIAKNPFGEEESPTFSLAVTENTNLPTFTQHPNSQFFEEGSTIELAANLLGNTTYSLSWFKDDNELQENNTKTLIIANASSSDAGIYYLVATNTEGSVSSEPATLTLKESSSPSILSQPTDTAVIENSSVALSVVATGEPYPKFQWRKDGIDIENATSPALVIEGATLSAQGLYDVAISNELGTILSDAITVSVLSGTASFIDEFIQSLPSSETYFSLQLASNTHWTAIAESDWIQVENGSTGDDEDKKISLKAQSNPSTQSREAAVNLYVGSKHTDSFLIQQIGRLPIVNISPKNKAIGSFATSYSLNIESADAWTATESSDWITISPDSGNGTTSIIVTIEENLQTSDREATITIGNSEHTISQTGNNEFDQWLSLHLNKQQLALEGITGAEGDADNDGLKNAVEYATYLDPSSPTSRLYTKTISTKGLRKILISPISDETIYEVLVSSDLKNWTAISNSKLMKNEDVLEIVLDNLEQRQFVKIQFSR